MTSSTPGSDEIVVEGCALLSLPKIADSMGNLTFIEGNVHLPYEFKRVFYLYDVPTDAERGGHALKSCHQLLIAVSGSFDVIVDDGTHRQRITLRRPQCGLHLSPMVWREIDRFSSGAVCLVIASERYAESDYFRNYADYEAALRQRSFDKANTAGS